MELKDMNDDDVLILNEHAKIMTRSADQSAINQVKEFIQHPAFVNKKARFMPDIHAGAGCVIGTTVELGNYVVPNIIGVDIGCGVLAIELGALDIDYKKLHKFILDCVPSGCVNRKTQDLSILQHVYKLMQEESGKDTPKTFDLFVDQLNDVATQVSAGVTTNASGTLGGGNHFIEVDEDSTTGAKYLVIHSGSRNFGLKVASYYQDLANYLITATNEDENQVMTAPNGAQYVRKKKSTLSKKLKPFADYKPYSADIKELAKGVSKSMAFLTGDHADSYIKCMKLAQTFARLNRRVMAYLILKHLGVKYHKCTLIESIHNYINFRDNIIRKGAISAHKGELVVIPLSMADGTIIGRGRGNPDWNNSAPHGAGRRFSRTAAKTNINMDEFRESMKYVWSECVNKNTLDEAPQAYKDAAFIKNRITSTIEIIAHLKPVFNFKTGVD